MSNKFYFRLPMIAYQEVVVLADSMEEAIQLVRNEDYAENHYETTEWDIPYNVSVEDFIEDCYEGSDEDD